MEVPPNGWFISPYVEMDDENWGYPHDSQRTPPKMSKAASQTCELPWTHGKITGDFATLWVSSGYQAWGPKVPKRWGKKQIRASYPLVNVYKKQTGKIHHVGKIHYFYGHVQ